MSDNEISKCDAAIIGVGPYGLSAAAHLRGCSIETVIIHSCGRP